MPGGSIILCAVAVLSGAADDLKFLGADHAHQRVNVVMIAVGE